MVTAVCQRHLWRSGVEGNSEVIAANRVMIAESHPVDCRIEFQTTEAGGRVTTGGFDRR